VLFHINGVLIRVEVGILSGVGAPTMSENVLSDFDTGNTGQMSGGGMSE
jgi:hypothetical protein